MHYLRSYDVICRFGGDDYVCSLAGQDLNGARDRFEQIAVRLAEASNGGDDQHQDRRTRRATTRSRI